MVGSTGGHLPHPWSVRRLRNLGSVPEPELHLRSISLTVLRARAVRRLAARVVRAQARMVAGVASFLSCPADSPLPRSVPVHVLLLSRSVLQGVLGRSAELCCR